MIPTQSQSSPSRVLVVPSMGFSGLTRSYLTGLDAFEERGLYNLARLVNPDAEVQFVTSVDLDPSFVAHLVDLIAETSGTKPEDLRKRLSITTLADQRNESLTSKLLDMSSEDIRTLSAWMPKEIDFWMYGPDEARLSEVIGAAPHGNGDAHDLLDDKSNTRRIFAELNIPTAPGREFIHSLDQALDSIRELHAANAASDKYILKLNNEDGGMGIGLIERLSPADDVKALRSILKTARDLPVQEFERELARQGGVMERFVEHPFTSAPSVKMEVLHDGTVTNLATHEQIMNGTACAGCSFPANAEYRGDLIRLGYQVADFAASKGYVGIISVDFLAVKSRPNERWQLLGIEINARKGGTTHPYFWTKALSNAVYDEKEGVLRFEGKELRYACRESIGCPEMKNLSTAAVLSRIKNAGLVFDRNKGTGILIHMMGRLETCGTIGATIIGRTEGEMDRTLHALNDALRTPAPEEATHGK